MTTYTATVTDTKITISRNGVWSGDGTISLREVPVQDRMDRQWSVTIADCAADLGEDVYEAIEDAISDELSGWDGVSAVHVTVAVEVDGE